MTTKIKSIKFWGENFLQSVGLSVFCAAIFAVFQIFRGDYSKGMTGLIMEALSLVPYYLFFSAVFVTLMLVIGYFQLYFSVLVSMNARRRSVAWGISGSIGLALMVVLMIAALIWKLVPGDISESGMQILPLLAGILFLMSAFFLILGGVSVKWGKIGKFIATILSMGMGAACGVTFAMQPNLAGIIMELGRGNFMPVCVIGIAGYLAASIFMEILTRKFEVRV